MSEFKNDDKKLLEKVEKVKADRKKSGIDSLVGRLQFAVINVEMQYLNGAAQEMTEYTGYAPAYAFEDEASTNVVMKEKSSADIIIRARKQGNNPFRAYNDYPKSKQLINTRLETFAFLTDDIEKYFDIRKSRGISFLTDEIQDMGEYLYVQTEPSKYTGISTGIIQWKGEKGSYRTVNSNDIGIGFMVDKPDYANKIGFFDHAAIRVRACDRDNAIIEFMNITNYDFKFSIYVKSLNSITNVARLSAEEFALVFTSGIGPYESDEKSGPTEKFIHNYGPRVHHMAFITQDIEEIFEDLKYDGLEFLSELVGSEQEGLKQTFSQESKCTFIVNEYIQRYGEFDGFFTKGNVEELTRATEKQ